MYKISEDQENLLLLEINRYNQELYNLVKDPGEHKNLVNSDREKVNDLKKELMEFINNLENKKIYLINKNQERIKIQRALRSNSLRI